MMIMAEACATFIVWIAKSKGETWQHHNDFPRLPGDKFIFFGVSLDELLRSIVGPIRL